MGLKSDIPEADWDAHWDNFGSRNLETFLIYFSICFIRGLLLEIEV
jgi:hypothetical protein